jgi:hypothetical protein
MAKTLPGVTGPFGFFDPLGFTAELSPSDLMLRREAELAHGDPAARTQHCRLSPLPRSPELGSPATVQGSNLF